MPDSTNNIWIDSTFYDPERTYDDTDVRYTTLIADNIGRYLTPVIYSPSEGINNFSNVQSVSTFQTISGSTLSNVAITYSTASGVVYYDGDLQSSLLLYPISFDVNSNITSMYLTGYSAISGAIDMRNNYISGNNYSIIHNIPAYFMNNPSLSGIKNFFSNYTNYTGSNEIDDSPIPSYSGSKNVINVYRNIFDTFYSSSVNNIVDISFAGWVDFPFLISCCSSSGIYSPEIYFEIESILGVVTNIETENYSCDCSNNYYISSVYSSITDIMNLPYEATVISGAVSPFTTTMYSSMPLNRGITMNIDLLSLKISNFSIPVGSYITASGIISVDVTDDEYDVSTIDTYIKIDNVIVPTTLSVIPDGYRLTHDSSEDFSSMSGPSVITVHATNTNGISIDEDFYVTFGYIVEYNNSKGFAEAIDYGFDNRVAVRITVEDYSNCPTQSSVAWEFDSKGMFNSDIGASINGRLYGLEQGNMPASIYPLSTAYFYGKEVRIAVTAKDFAGNEMEPLVLSYRIEDKP